MSAVTLAVRRGLAHIASMPQSGRMTILVAASKSAESAAAHAAAVREAALRGEDLVFFSLDGTEPDSTAADAGVTETVAHPNERGRDAIGDLLDYAEAHDVSRLVVGLRHRSPVGKLLMGSAAQQIILQSTVPVLCVKP